jgi:hypothetical protein
MCNVRNVKCNVQTGVLAVQGLSASVTSDVRHLEGIAFHLQKSVNTTHSQFHLSRDKSEHTRLKLHADMATPQTLETVRRIQVAMATGYSSMGAW